MGYIILLLERNLDDKKLGDETCDRTCDTDSNELGAEVAGRRVPTNIRVLILIVAGRDALLSGQEVCVDAPAWVTFVLINSGPKNNPVGLLNFLLL